MARRPGLSLFTLSVLVLLALLIPPEYVNIPRPVELNVFLLLWVGVALSSSLSYLSSTGLVLSLFPCFQAFMVTGGYSGFLELGFFSATLAGAFALSRRRGMRMVMAVRQGVVLALVTMISIRFTGFLYHLIFPDAGTGYIQQVLHMALIIPVLIYFNLHLRALVKLRPMSHSGRNLKVFLQIIALPVLSSPLLAQAGADLASGTAFHDGFWLVSLSAGTFALLAVQVGSTIVFERSKYARGRAFEAEKTMAQLSRNLAACNSPLQALRHLTEAWFTTARPEAVRVTWRNVSYAFPAEEERFRDSPLMRRGRSGLQVEVWPTMDTSLDPDRMDAFISQTETAILNQELHRTVTSRAWDFMEAMVYSLDRSDHRLSGYSKFVAEIALGIGNRLLLQPGQLENLRMAALLHHAAPMLISGEVERQSSFDKAPDSMKFHLPEETLNALVHMNENFDGSGAPGGLRETSIPLFARILSIAAAFTRISQTNGQKKALSEIELRKGSIYDPRLVDLLAAVQENG